jgi:hypothetical protein
MLTGSKNPFSLRWSRLLSHSQPQSETIILRRFFSIRVDIVISNGKVVINDAAR